MDTAKLSNRILYILLGLSVLVVILFFAVGYGNEEEINGKILQSPATTDVLLGWNAFLLLATVGLMIWSFCKYVKEWGFNKSYLYTWGLPIVTAVIGLVVGLAEKDEHMLINGKDWNMPSDIIITDTCIISIGILLVLAIAAIIFSLVRDFKK